MSDRELARHLLAILAYRGGKPLREAPETFVRFDTGEGTTPLSILGHLGDLMAGPIADALTHVGQLMMLRRMTGSPVKGENYYKADIVTGRVGPEQSAP